MIMNNQNTFYIHTDTSGYNTEGIGAVAQDQLGCYFFAKNFNCKFFFKGFEKIHHYQYFDVTQEQFCKDFDLLFNNFNSEKLDISTCKEFSYETVDENFFNFIKTKSSLNKNYLIRLKTGIVFKFMEQNLNLAEQNNVFEDLKSNLWIPQEKKYFDPKKINISFHIRKYTQTDCDPAAYRECFTNKKEYYYINLINNIVDSLKEENLEKEFHIFSQGEEKDFDFLKSIVFPEDCKLILHIEEYPSISLYHMINSDILIMANSSFSFISHVLGNQVSLVRNNFYYKTYDSKKNLVDSHGNFNKKHLNFTMKKWLTENKKI